MGICDWPNHDCLSSFGLNTCTRSKNWFSGQTKPQRALMAAMFLLGHCLSIMVCCSTYAGWKMRGKCSVAVLTLWNGPASDIMNCDVQRHYCMGHLSDASWRASNSWRLSSRGVRTAETQATNFQCSELACRKSNGWISRTLPTPDRRRNWTVRTVRR